MPLPRGIARFNRRVTNRVTRPFAARLGGFAVLKHQGRTSGTLYETPLNAWRHDHSIVVALTYGDQVDWLKNARSAESSVMVIEGTELRVGRPTDLEPEEGRALMPPFVRLILGILGVEGFVDFPVLNRPS